MNCLKYWDMCHSVSVDAAVSLWCDVEPSMMAGLNFSTSCMDVKRELITQAIEGGLLEVVIEQKPFSCSTREAVQKNWVVIKKDSLRRWFMDMPAGDRPAFLFDESRQLVAADGSEVAEMNATRALAVMAWILAENKPSLSINGRPNVSKIATAVEPLAQKAFGDDVRGFASFNKRLGKALDLLSEQPTIYF